MPEEVTEYVNPWGPGGESYSDWETNTWVAEVEAPAAPEALTGAKRERIALAPPALVPQQGASCWAATLASWRGASGRQGATFDQVMAEYKAKNLVGSGGEITYANGQTMLAMEGMKSASMAGANVTRSWFTGSNERHQAPLRRTTSPW